MNDRIRRTLLSLLVALCAISTLAACGKKGALESPPGEEQKYPRHYPSK